MRHAGLVVFLALVVATAGTTFAAGQTPVPRPPAYPAPPVPPENPELPEDSDGPGISDTQHAFLKFPFPWFASGGDGGSPWPTLQLPETVRAESAALGEVRLYTYSDWNGHDHDVKLVRITPDGGSQVFVLSDHPNEDLRPRLTSSAFGPPAVVWHRPRPGGLELMAVRLGADGAPAGAATRLARFGRRTIDATGMLLADGDALVAMARRDRTETVIEARWGDRPTVPLGTAPDDADVRIGILLDAEGVPTLTWDAGGQTSASVAADPEGQRWGTPRYQRRSSRR